MEDPRQRFTAAAADYGKYRPGYPGELVDWIAETTGVRPPAEVADVGCGTGISTRLFAARGYSVVGIDPNEAMLAEAKAAGGARFVRAEAVATGLAAASVDLVVSAQAMHWFDLEAALAEFGRILRPGSWAGAFWNLRASTPLMDEYEALLVGASPWYAAREKASETIRAIERRAAGPRRAEFRNRQVLDREGFRGRVESSSYVVHDVADRASFDRALDDLFARHAAGGRVEFVYRTVAVAWRGLQ